LSLKYEDTIAIGLEKLDQKLVTLS